MASDEKPSRRFPRRLRDTSHDELWYGRHRLQAMRTDTSPAGRKFQVEWSELARASDSASEALRAGRPRSGLRDLAERIDELREMDPGSSASEHFDRVQHFCERWRLDAWWCLPAVAAVHLSGNPDNLDLVPDLNMMMEPE